VARLFFLLQFSFYIYFPLNFTTLPIHTNTHLSFLSFLLQSFHRSKSFFILRSVFFKFITLNLLFHSLFFVSLDLDLVYILHASMTCHRFQLNHHFFCWCFCLIYCKTMFCFLIFDVIYMLRYFLLSLDVVLFFSDVVLRSCL